MRCGRSQARAPRWLRRVLPLCAHGALLVASLCTAEIAEAFPSARLVYTRGAGAVHCPDESTLRKAVAKRLGYDPFFPIADRTIVASVVFENETLKAQAELVDERGIVLGTRVYVAPPNRCEDLVYALALSISISIDPASAEQREPASTPTVSAKEPEHAPAARPAPASGAGAKAQTKASDGVGERDQRPVPEHDEAPLVSGLRWAVGLDTRVLIGTSPSTTFGGGASLSGRWRGWSARTELGAEWPSTYEMRAGSDPVRIRAWQAWAAVAPCTHLDVLFFCGVFLAGRFSVHRADLESIGDTQAIAAAGGRMGVEMTLQQPLALRLQSDLLATLVRTPVTLQGQEVWRAPAWSMSLGVALLVQFP